MKEVWRLVSSIDLTDEMSYGLDTQRPVRITSHIRDYAGPIGILLSVFCVSI